MSITPEAKRFIEAERAIEGTAEQILDTEFPASRPLIKQLLEYTYAYAPILEEYDGTDDPFQIARLALRHAAKDDRLLPSQEFPPEYINPNDAYSRRIYARQLRVQNVFHFIGMTQRRNEKVTGSS
jgi:hypothetical protein